MGDGVVAQKPLFYEFSLDRHVPTDYLHSARISFDRCGRVSFRLNYAHLNGSALPRSSKGEIGRYTDPGEQCRSCRKW